MNAHDNTLSIFSLIAGASLLVQLVMLVLFLASVISWVMIVQRAAYQGRVKSALDDFEDQFWSGVDLTQLYRKGNELASQGKLEGVEMIFRAGYKEFSRLRQQDKVDIDAVMEGTQ